MERPIVTDLTDRYQHKFAGGMEPKTLHLQNSHASTGAYVSFRADDGSTIPSATDFDVVVPFGGAPVELEDFSVSVAISSYLENLSMFRY